MSRIRGWLRQRYVARHNENQLREFVYLDDVSVFSLIASRLGAIAREYTDSQSRSLKATWSLSDQADGVVGTATSTSALEVGRSRTAQVVRQANVQSTFRDLYQFERQALPLRHLGRKDKVPRVSRLEDLPKLQAPWCYRADELKRGLLVEIEGKLSTDPLYRLIAIVDTIVRIAERASAIFPAGLGADATGTTQLTQVIEDLMVGLVPVSVVASRYEVVKVGDDEFVAHSSVLDVIRKESEVASVPLEVVGVAETTLFWRDLRRVLYSGATFTLFCRVSNSGLTDSWEPVKMLDLLSEVSDSLSTTLRQLGPEGLAAMSAATSTTEQSASASVLEVPLSDFLDRACAVLGIQKTDVMTAAVAAVAAESRDEESAEERWRAAVDELCIRLEPLGLGIEDPEQKVQIRGAFPSASGPAGEPKTIPPAQPVRVLETDVVAIYW